MWQNEEIAKGLKKSCIELEGNIYFPVDCVNMKFLSESDKKTTCSWKGDASYYTVTVRGKVNTDAAWCYRDPKKEASQIKGFIAFFKGVTIENT